MFLYFFLLILFSSIYLTIAYNEYQKEKYQFAWSALQEAIDEEYQMNELIKLKENLSNHFMTRAREIARDYGAQYVYTYVYAVKDYINLSYLNLKQ